MDIALDQLEARDLGRMLRRTVIAPGGTAGGMVAVHAEDLKGGRPLRLVVNAGGEKRAFLYTVGG